MSRAKEDGLKQSQFSLPLTLMVWRPTEAGALSHRGSHTCIGEAEGSMCNSHRV